MQIEFIHSFLVTAECGSLSKASEKLSLTHPALSKQIRSLEAYYGTSLFKRSPGGVELTDSGKILLNRIRPLYNEWLAIRRELHEGSVPRAVKLGTLPSLAAHYLPARMPDIERRGLRVEPVVAPTSQELRELLRSGTVDAVLCEPLPAGSANWSAELFKEPFYAVARRDHPLAGESALPVASFKDAPLVLHPPACGIRRRFAELCRESGFDPTLRVEANFGEFLIGYVAAGSGLTIVPKLVADTLRHPGLVAMPIADAKAGRAIALAAASREIGKALLPALRPR